MVPVIHVLKVRSHQTRMTRINRAIRAKLDAWTFWVYSRHSHMKFTTQQTWICVMGGASARQLQSRCKIYSCFCKSRKMYIQIRVPTYNHNYFVLHCCFGFSASARNDVTARASSWLVNAARISAKVQIFQLARIAQKKRSIRAASFARIAPQDCLSRLCIDLTCKSFTRFESFASGVNAPLDCLSSAMLFAGFLVYHLLKRLPSGTTAMQTNLMQSAAYDLSTDRLIPPPLQPLQQCWQHSYVYLPNTNSGYDAEQVHSTFLVDYGEACFELNLSC